MYRIVLENVSWLHAFEVTRVKVAGVFFSFFFYKRAYVILNINLLKTDLRNNKKRNKIYHAYIFQRLISLFIYKSCMLLSRVKFTRVRRFLTMAV